MLLGWFLLFKGILDVMLALATRHANDLWWLGMATGIIEIGLAFWAAGHFAGSAALLIVWVGISALMRGIVVALMLRRLASSGALSGKAVAAWSGDAAQGRQLWSPRQTRPARRRTP